MGGAELSPWLLAAILPALTISLTDLLPGLLVLVLAGVFRRGAELRDFEAHVI